MDKYTVDLDKVLNDFEYSELTDSQQNLSQQTQISKATSTSTLPSQNTSNLTHVSPELQPSQLTPFTPQLTALTSGTHQLTLTPQLTTQHLTLTSSSQPLTSSQITPLPTQITNVFPSTSHSVKVKNVNSKHSITNVFNSLNEYLNSDISGLSKDKPILHVNENDPNEFLEKFSYDSKIPFKNLGLETSEQNVVVENVSLKKQTNFDLDLKNDFTVENSNLKEVEKSPVDFITGSPMEQQIKRNEIMNKTDEITHRTDEITNRTDDIDDNAENSDFYENTEGSDYYDNNTDYGENSDGNEIIQKHDNETGEHNKNGEDNEKSEDNQRRKAIRRKQREEECQNTNENFRQEDRLREDENRRNLSQNEETGYEREDEEEHNRVNCETVTVAVIENDYKRTERKLEEMKNEEIKRHEEMQKYERTAKESEEIGTENEEIITGSEGIAKVNVGIVKENDEIVKENEEIIEENEIVQENVKGNKEIVKINEKMSGINEEMSEINEEISGINEEISGINEKISGINKEIAIEETSCNPEKDPRTQQTKKLQEQVSIGFDDTFDMDESELDKYLDDLESQYTETNVKNTDIEQGSTLDYSSTLRYEDDPSIDTALSKTIDVSMTVTMGTNEAAKSNENPSGTVEESNKTNEDEGNLKKTPSTDNSALTEVTDDLGSNSNSSEDVNSLERPKTLELSFDSSESKREINLIGAPGSTPYNNVYVSKELPKSTPIPAHRPSSRSETDSSCSVSPTFSNASTESVQSTSECSTDPIQDDYDDRRGDDRKLKQSVEVVRVGQQNKLADFKEESSKCLSCEIGGSGNNANVNSVDPIDKSDVDDNGDVNKSDFVKNVNADKNKFTSEMGAVYSDVEAVNSNIAAVNSNITTANSNLTTLNSNITVNSDISTRNSDVSKNSKGSSSDNNENNPTSESDIVNSDTVNDDVSNNFAGEDVATNEISNNDTSSNISNNNNSNNDVSGAEGPIMGLGALDDVSIPSDSGAVSWLGKQAPLWIPDSEALTCLHCDTRFTVIKRRHHCRACGLVLCSKCCNLKYKLEYLDAEARVCFKCFDILNRDTNSSSGSEAMSPASGNSPNRLAQNQPNPNNPMEYCSVVPPLQQVGNMNQNPPSVMVPVGVLKRKGSKKSNKSVMFCDGIRPGSDLTNLDNDFNYNDTKKLSTVASTSSSVVQKVSTSANKNLPQFDGTTKSFIPSSENSLPPTVTLYKSDISYSDCANSPNVVEMLKNETLIFAIHRNLYVHVKIINMNCCINKTAWCFTTEGLITVGQDEVVFLLEYEDGEKIVPKDLFYHINNIFNDAVKGTTVTELGISLHNNPTFLDSKNHSGFLYVRPTFQCLQNVIVPKEPYLVGILIHRWETPWAKIFPLRLILRLGAEYRYYPCPIISTRQRESVFVEIGHTIIKLLADFRNFSYTLPNIRGLTIHMEDKNTTVTIPVNRYDQVMKSLNNSSDHILAFGGNFSSKADSHLVCIQDTQGSNENSYTTHAINIQNKPRKVTGASFIVFNGALKSTSGLTAKSSIIEDGLMIQIPAEHMVQVRESLRNMKNHSIQCGCVNAVSDETVSIVWGEPDVNFNLCVISPIDKLPLSGIPSIRVHNGKDFVCNSGNRLIRWTEVFILQNGDENARTQQDPVDISKLAESISKATCQALVKYLDLLASNNFYKVGIRAMLHVENVSYMAGSNGLKLPPIYMRSLDNELIPVLHRITSNNLGENSIVLELIFRILNI